MDIDEVVDKRVLVRKRKACGSYTSSAKDLMMLVEACKSIISHVKCFLIQTISANQIAKIKEIMYSFYHCGRNKAFDSREKHLLIKYVSFRRYDDKIIFTFISAFESSPVHCLNL